MATYEIPLTPEAQKFSISLGGKDYSIVVRWNSFCNSWLMDLSDADELPILNALPLVVGVDLLSPYPYLKFGGPLIVDCPGGSLVAPNYDELGSSGRLYFITP